MATRAPAEEVLALARALDPEASMYMYLDDGYIVAEPAAMEPILTRIRVAFGHYGLALNEAKLQVWAADHR